MDLGFSLGTRGYLAAGLPISFRDMEVIESMHDKHRKPSDYILGSARRRMESGQFWVDRMARYLVQIPRDGLSEASKAAIARTIGEVHAEIMSVSSDAVQIAITEIDAGCFFASGRLLECDHIFVHGYLPDDDRTRKLKSALSSRLAADVTRAANFEPDSTWVSITETPAA
jgi:phenylpyruvate tautomerase PptA (4-oxalocrotonate tautomerase family)